MALPLANSLESGQADGTAITTANSGGGAGDAFNAVAGSVVYSTAHAISGSNAFKFDTTATFAAAHVDWSGFGLLTTSVFFRLYIYLTAYPASGPRFIGIRKSSPAGNSAFISITTAGKVQAMNAAQSGVLTGTTSIPLNQWVRLEFRILSSTTVGEAEWWLYLDPHAAIGSPDEHMTSPSNLVLGANTDGVQWGPTTISGPANWVGWIDEVAVATSQIGPAAIAQIESPSGIASAQAFGTPQENILFTVGGLASAQAFGTPSVTTSGGGNQSVSPAGLASAQAFGTLVTQPGPVTVPVNGVLSAQQFAPIKANQMIHLPGIASAQAFGTPTLIPGPAITAVPGLASAQAFGSEQVSGGIGPTFNPAIHGGRHHH